MSDLLTRDALMAGKQERQYKYVDLPSPNIDGSGGPVRARLRKEFAHEWLAILDASDSNDTEERIGFRHVEFCWVDEDGKRVLQDGDTRQDWWKRLDPAFVFKLVQEVTTFNESGFSALRVLEASRKNSPEEASQASQDASQPTSGSQT